jgi:hypothetical protein
MENLEEIVGLRIKFTPDLNAANTAQIWLNKKKATAPSQEILAEYNKYKVEEADLDNNPDTRDKVISSTLFFILFYLFYFLFIFIFFFNNKKMTKLVMSKYSCLTNKPLFTDWSGSLTAMSFDLPLWFTNWNKNKIIKVYGCSWCYLESVNKKPILSNIYANQFISVYSNIAHNDTVILHSKYDDVLPNDYLSSPNESSVSMDFMMVVNNYYTPKIYDLTNSEIKDIRIQFRDPYGKLIPICSSYSANNNNTTQEEIEPSNF